MTCEYCNGTHVYRAEDNSKILFQPCPVCGPEPAEVVSQRMRELRQRLELLMKEGA